jgi:hypothetical protein
MEYLDKDKLFLLKKTQEIIPSYFRTKIKHNIYLDLLKNGMMGAIESENLNLINYFVEEMEEEIESDHLRKAVEMKNLKILNYLYSNNNIINLNKLLSLAVEKGDKEIINYLIKNGANYLIKNGANDWNEGLEGAVNGNNTEMFDYFLSKGGDHIDYLFEVAVKNGNKEIIKRIFDLSIPIIFDLSIPIMFLNRGYKVALKTHNKDLIDFITNLISQKYKIRNSKVYGRI